MPFEVVEADILAPESQMLSPDDVRSQFVEALLARDIAALRALWPSSS